MLVTLDLISIEIGVGTSDSAMVIPKPLMGSVLLLPLFCSWGGRGWRWAMPHQAPMASQGAFSVGEGERGSSLDLRRAPSADTGPACSVPEQRLSLC